MIDKTSYVREHERYNEIKNKRTKVNGSKIKKRNLMKKRIKVTALLALVSSLSITVVNLGEKALENFKANDIIANKVNEFAKGYGIIDNANGYIAILDGRQISLDSAIEDIINDARYAGMDDAEIWIGLSTLYDDSLADKYVGDIAEEEKQDARYVALYSEKLKELGRLDESGNLTSGGISR